MQAQEPVSVHLSEKEGLPDKEFYSILEDDKGFIWLCADKGFFRYDGKIFKKYTHANQIGLSVFNVQQGPLKRIWCNNISGQFFYIKDDKLNLFIDLSKTLKGELADFVVNDKYLWVFTLGEIYKVNIKTKKIEFTFKNKKKIGTPFEYNNAIYFQNSDSISSITSTNNIKHVLPIKLPSKYKYGNVIGQGKSKHFKVGTSLFLMENRSFVNTFFQFDITKKSFHLIKGLEAVAKERIYTQFENENEIWIGTNSGVFVYELLADNFRLKKRFLKDKNITKILKDKDDNYWFTTLNNGIYVMPNINIEACVISEKHKNISSLDVINDSTLVFGTKDGNVGFYNVITNKEKSILLPTKDRVSTLKYHPKKNTVFISKDLQSYVLNYKTLKLTKIDGDKRFNTAKSLTALKNNDLLLTSYSSVRILKKADFSNEVLDVSNRKRTYASLYNKTKNEVHIAFVDDLIRYDSIWNPTIIQYKNKSIYGKSISETINGIIWVSTFKNGVFGIKNDSVIHHYTTANGLSSNNIERIKAYKNKLWICLDNSIQLLDVTTGQLKSLRKSDGVLSYDISGIEILNNKVYFSSNEGLFSIHKEKSFKSQSPEIYFNTVEINERDTLVTSHYKLKYNQNAIKIGFNVNDFLYNQKGKYKYRLKGFNEDWLITDVGVNSVKYNSLPAGKFIFQVQPLLDNQTQKGKIKELRIIIRSPFWETWWFIWGISFFVLISTIFYFRYQIKKKEEERVVQLEKISLEKELIAINLTALRSQMNPHFIFNALNSIQDLVLKKDTEASYDYIVLFAELIRNALSYSNQDFISIEKELNFLKVYLQLENLRFGDDFKYTISFNSDENLDIPSLLIQPFIENALVHGLLHKAGKKVLDIEFSFINNVLQCVITDNGIGRKEAAKISSRQGNHHDSFALGAIEKRLEIFRKQYNEHIGYVIKDLYENQTAKGTKIIIKMPFKKRF
ncbi:hypothetical protein A9Q86_01960 [Flavobacteriales bacterium 33_180_T64]|nr:hypothetical protein A9Q86_01960 [Flavobacteriales bacterium 33_180_T64]